VDPARFGAVNAPFVTPDDPDPVVKYRAVPTGPVGVQYTTRYNVFVVNNTGVGSTAVCHPNPRGVIVTSVPASTAPVPATYTLAVIGPVVSHDPRHTRISLTHHVPVVTLNSVPTVVRAYWP
jgi:hypothetical protein